MSMFDNILHWEVPPTSIKVMISTWYRLLRKFRCQNQYWEGKNGIRTFLMEIINLKIIMLLQPDCLKVTVIEHKTESSLS